MEQRDREQRHQRAGPVPQNPAGPVSEAQLQVLHHLGHVLHDMEPLKYQRERHEGEGCLPNATWPVLVQAEQHVERGEQCEVGHVIDEVDRFDVRHAAQDTVAVGDAKEIALNDLREALHEVEALDRQECEGKTRRVRGVTTSRVRICVAMAPRSMDASSATCCGPPDSPPGTRAIIPHVPRRPLKRRASV